MTARDSIEHAKKCLFGKFHGDVHGGSVGRASVFHVKVSGSNLTLVTFNYFFLFDTSNSLISFKVNKYNYVTMEFSKLCLLNSIAQLTTVAIYMC